ncbi:hypothetical protein [Dankookia sp. P2]
MQVHVDEFGWRWSRRNIRHASFDRLLGGLAELPHRAYRDFVPGSVAGTA